RFTTAAGEGGGYLARPREDGRLPALVLVHDRAGLDAWMKTCAVEMAGIGYVVFVVDLEQRTPQAVPDHLAAALRWLKNRAEVAPERIGLVGFGSGAEQALRLAATVPVQACVACDGVLRVDRALIAGLRTTPLLIVSAGQDRSLPAFRNALAGSRRV